MLEKGPAYGRTSEDLSASVNADSDWPTYRHDARRSGATEANVGTELKVAWRADIGTAGSGIVVSDGRVLVAGVESHSVHALDVADGKQQWRAIVGARVDSPPTFHGGTAIFGSADGRVHCVRSKDGANVWRFDATPKRRLMMAHGQLESARPVPGSVLVRDGQCWFAAGRSSYLDGGISAYTLDASTGEVVLSETIYDPDPKTGRTHPEPSANTMQGLLNDIPVTDGVNVFIRQRQLSSSDGRGGQRLFPTGGFLDSSWFNRTAWQVGPAKTSGMMVLGRNVAFGTELYASKNRDTVFRPGSNAYRLICLPLEKPTTKSTDQRDAAKKRRQQGPKPLWEQRLGIRVTAMIRAGNVVFVGGSPDIVDPEDPHAAWEGRLGGRLAAYATDTGETLAEYDLPAPPVWDGMAATDGRLFISTSDGSVLCMESR
jgi:outer membrane protein assembly factor BamB